jgi:hypothetical protein
MQVRLSVRHDERHEKWSRPPVAHHPGGGGFSVAALGWILIMTAILAFIGLPLFFIGLALVQAQES